MDFPNIEKCYSHASHHPPSESSADDSAPTSPTTSISKYEELRAPFDALTQAATRPSQLSRQVTRVTTSGTTYTFDQAFEVDWADDDPENPRNWPIWYKVLSMFFLSISTLVVVLYSTSYTSAIPAMMDEFGVESKAIATLGLTTYLIGLAIGSVLLAPISETYGRKPVYVVTLFFFAVLVIPCALAKDMTTLIVVRFFGAVAGSSLIANAPGTIGDMVGENKRAMAFSFWSIGPMNGPVFGPIFGGFVTQYLGWRWANWIVLILGAASFVMMLSIRETYAPVLLQKRAAALRKSEGENRYWSRYDVRVGFVELMKVNLSRPFIMAVKEPICIFWNVYIGIIYAELYLSFASYPIVFHEERGWDLGDSSLSFVGIGVGIMITIFMASPIKKMIDSHKRDAEGDVAPESMMSVVCIAAILVPIGQLWFAWTCLPASIHPAISIAAGIPFGAGNAAIFIYASNYLVGSYGIYAASALAGNAVIRSVLGGVLPLAGPPLYAALGANWAGTFLGLLEAIIIPIPFIFYRYGYKIREKSTLIREMRENEMKEERRKKKAEERARREARQESNNNQTIDCVSNTAITTGDEPKGNGVAERRYTTDDRDRDVEKEAEAELAHIRGIAVEESFDHHRSKQDI